MQSLGGPVVTLGELTLERILETEDAKEETDRLVRFGAETGMDRLLIMPNYEPPSLNPPQGYVGEFGASNEFSQDPFVGEKYKVFMACEVKTPIKAIDLKKAKDTLPLLIPRGTSFSPPSPNDKLSGGWTPALNGQGSFCGLYKAEEKDHDTGQKWERLYVVVHTCLPQQTLWAAEQLDTEAHLANINTRDFRDDLSAVQQEASRNPPAQRVWDTSGDKPRITYLDMFGPGSVNENLRALSIENAKRICALVADAFQAELFTYHDGEMGLWEGAEEFRDERGDVPRRFLEREKEEELAVALGKWPTGVPIPSYTRVNDYPLGPVLAILRDEEEDKYTALAQRFSLNLHTHPLTARMEPEFVQEYQTYRILPNGNIAWYSNCSPGAMVDNIPLGGTPRHGVSRFSGVLQLQPLDLGLRVAQASFMPPAHGDNLVMRQMTAPVPPPGEFATPACAVPCVFPFVEDERGLCNRPNVFFTHTSSTPGVFKGRFQMRRTLVQSVKESLGGIDLYEGQNSVELDPVLVYCPGPAWTKPRY